MTRRPRVSVVTVNRNMARDLEVTLESVCSQDYADFEAVVIDGNSTDDSMSVIAAYAPRIAHWVSEPDRNLYDAMNKGVARASGEWIIFMNSGDRFAKPDVLSQVFAACHGDADLLYGDVIRCYADQGIERLIPAETIDVLPKRMNCSHQALFARRSLLQERPFAMGLLAADYDWILNAHATGKKFKPVPHVIARATAGGRSDKFRFTSLSQRVAIVRKAGLMTPGIAFHYGYLFARALAAQTMRRILPRKMIAGILRKRPLSGMG